MAYVIDQDRCINCWWCRRECPTDCIHYFDQPNRKHWVDPEYCIDCDICRQVCPMDCIWVDSEYKPEPAHLEAAKGHAKQKARERRQTQLLLRGYVDEQLIVLKEGSR